MGILYDNLPEVVPVDPYREETPGKSTQNEQVQGDDEEKEVLVVPAPHAVVHPRAVVVKPL